MANPGSSKSFHPQAKGLRDWGFRMWGIRGSGHKVEGLDLKSFVVASNCIHDHDGCKRAEEGSVHDRMNDGPLLLTTKTNQITKTCLFGKSRSNS